MDLRRKLPLITTALVVTLCLSLAAAAFVGLNRMMLLTGQQVDEHLTALVTDNLMQGAQRERELVQGVIDNAKNQIAALVASPSVQSALLADRDQNLMQQALRPIAAVTLELGRSVQGQIDKLPQLLNVSLEAGRLGIEKGGTWRTAGEPLAWETTDQSGASATVRLPPLTVNGQPILVTDDPTQPVPQVDEPAALTGAMFTIFQRSADDRFVRIATTVQRQGKRAIRTALTPVDKNGAANPVLAEILAGGIKKEPGAVVLAIRSWSCPVWPSPSPGRSTAPAAMPSSSMPMAASSCIPRLNCAASTCWRTCISTASSPCWRRRRTATSAPAGTAMRGGTSSPATTACPGGTGRWWPPGSPTRSAPNCSPRPGRACSAR